MALCSSKFRGLRSDLIRLFDSPNQLQERVAFLSSLPNIFYVCLTGIPSCLPYLFTCEGSKFLKKMDLKSLYFSSFHDDVNGISSHLQHCAILRSLSFLLIIHSITSNNGKSASSADEYSYICFDVNGMKKYISDIEMDGISIDLGSTIHILRNNPLEHWQSFLDAKIVPSLSGEFIDQFSSLLNGSNIQNLLNNADSRKHVFEILALLLVLSPKDSVDLVVGDFASELNLIFAGDHRTSQISHVLQWLLRIPFADESDELRMYAARWIPEILFCQDVRLLYHFHSFEQATESTSNIVELSLIISYFFEHVDAMIFDYCGIPNITKYSARKNMNLAKIFDLDFQVENKIKLRQISAITFISNMTRCIKKDRDEYEIVREKCILRLMCFWAIATLRQNNLDCAETFAHCQVASKAYCELLVLEEICLLKNVSRFGNSIQSRLISEILSVVMFAQSMISSENDSHKYGFMYNFVRSFLVQLPTSQMNHVKIVEEPCNVLSSFDSILPFAIAGLVIKKDYSSICELTRFRLKLLAEIKRLERKEKSDSNRFEKLLGKHTRKSFQINFNKVCSEDELVRQTARLCVMKTDNLNILTPIMKSLLLEQDKSAIVFFMKKVVRLKASFGELLKNSEFLLLDELVCELGHCEKYLQRDDYRQGVWKEKYKDQHAFHALKRGALFLHSNVILEEHDGKKSPSLSFEPQDINGINVDDLVQQWIRKYFMRLLVNVTTKWKRGKIATKISAMGSLRVLLRFLPEDDSAQYVTHIFGIVDGCMTQRIASDEDVVLLSWLRLLAVRCLAHFTQILLSYDIDCVGQNLCNIIVSLTPLFDDTVDIPNDDPLSSIVLHDGIELLETLVDGEVGKALACYFESVPFLPEDYRLQNIRDALKRQGVNFDSLFLLSTQLGSMEISCSKRESISSTCSTATDEDRSSLIQTNKLHMALRKRLYYLEKFLNHENDNVRKQCLSYLINLVRGHRDLFHSASKIDDASIRFLTVILERAPGCGKWPVDFNNAVTVKKL